MRSVLVFFFIAPLLVGLGACVLDKSAGGPDNGAAATPAAPQITPTAGLTPQERNVLAIELLNEGKADRARVELEASLAELPADRNARAQNLLSQIDADPIAMLGSENWKYTVQKGESLSIIAGRYLNDTLKFFALARYNGMDNPSQLQVGEVIRVPGREPPPRKKAQGADAADSGSGGGAPATVEPTPQTAAGGAQTGAAMPQTAEGGAQAEPAAPQAAEGGGQAGPATPQTAQGASATTAESGSQVAEGADTPAAESQTAGAGGEPEMAKVDPSRTEISDTEKIQTLLTTADEKANSGNFPDAISIIEAGLTEFPGEPIVKQFAAGTYVKFGASLRERHNYQEAFSAVQRAAALDPKNDAISRLLEEAKQAARADGLYRDGQKYEKADAKIDALQSYQAALKVWPDHDAAQMALAKVTPEVAEIYYREARTAFQRQDLDTALKYYDKTLEVDPNHEPAKLERQRTIQLKKKLAGKDDG